MAATMPLYGYRAFVARVVDGDTLSLTVDLGFFLRFTGMFRLLGVNAREKSEPGGQDAKANLTALLPVDTEVHLTSVKVDKYGGRYDAAITLTDGTDLSTKLIREGWAAPWDGSGTRTLPDWPRK